MKKIYLLLTISLAVLTAFAFVHLNNDLINGDDSLIESEQLTFRVDTVATDLEIPWGMAFLPNGDILVTERKGTLRLIQDGQLHPDPIGNVPEVRAKGQGGLFDLELHPNYAENGWIYISFASTAKPGEEGEGANTELVRAKLKDHSLVEIESIFKASPNYKKTQHFGARIEFDRQGYLYLSVGDRGGRDEVQTRANYRGRVLRFHDDGSIPKDNPFITDPTAKPEIFSYGHRNPQGMSMNPLTGDIWEHEHGPQGGDEVNIIKGGNNYGWPVISYGINYDNSILTEEFAREGMEQPVLYWKPSIAPCGMDFVESDLYGPAWKNNLLVGSMKFQYLNRCEVQDNRIIHQEKLLEGMGRVRVVRQAPDGYIYVGLEGPGRVVKLVPVTE